MLLQTLYEIKSMECFPGRVEATLLLDHRHPLFQGHFPGAPVLPGVCMMHMVKEILEKAVASPLTLQEAAYAKFLSMVNPVDSEPIHMHIEYFLREDQRYEVKASLLAGSRTCLKYQALFQLAK